MVSLGVAAVVALLGEATATAALLGEAVVAGLVTAGAVLTATLLAGDTADDNVDAAAAGSLNLSPSLDVITAVRDVLAGVIKSLGLFIVVVDSVTLAVLPGDDTLLAVAIVRGGLDGDAVVSTYTHAQKM